MRDENGVYRSLNGGTSWAAAAGIMANNGCTTSRFGPTQRPTRSSPPAGLWRRRTSTGTRMAAARERWDVVLNEAGMWRTSLAIAKSNQNVIYRPRHGRCRRHVQAGPAGGLPVDHRRRERNLDGAGAQHVPDEAQHAAASRIRGEATKAACASGLDSEQPGVDDNVIAVDPVDSNVVWVGGVDLFRSDDGGLSWGHASRWDRSPVVHADQHVIVFHPSYDARRTRRCGSGTTAASSRRPTPGPPPRRLRAARGRPTGHLHPVGQPQQRVRGDAVSTTGRTYPDGATYIGGATGQRDGAGQRRRRARCVDRDRRRRRRLRRSRQEHDERRSTARTRTSRSGGSDNGGTSWTSKTSGVRSNTCDFAAGGRVLPVHHALHHARADADPALGRRVVCLAETTDSADNWSQTGQATPGSSANKVSAIDNAPTDGNRLLVGMSTEGQILRLSNALAATSATVWGVATPRAGYVSSVAFDPNDANVAYATYSTFGGTHVWKVDRQRGELERQRRLRAGRPCPTSPCTPSSSTRQLLPPLHRHGHRRLRQPRRGRQLVGGDHRVRQRPDREAPCDTTASDGRCSRSRTDAAPSRWALSERRRTTLRRRPGFWRRLGRNPRHERQRVEADPRARPRRQQRRRLDLVLVDRARATERSRCRPWALRRPPTRRSPSTPARRSAP